MARCHFACSFESGDAGYCGELFPVRESGLFAWSGGEMSIPTFKTAPKVMPWQRVVAFVITTKKLNTTTSLEVTIVGIPLCFNVLSRTSLRFEVARYLWARPTTKDQKSAFRPAWRNRWACTSRWARWTSGQCGHASTSYQTEIVLKTCSSTAIRGLE